MTVNELREELKDLEKRTRFLERAYASIMAVGGTLVFLMGFLSLKLQITAGH